MKRILTFSIILFLGGIPLSAQDFESYKRQQQEAFQAYKNKTQEEWDAYRRKVNADFAESIKKPWEKKTGEPPKADPRKEPDIPPVILPELDVQIPEDKPIDVDVNFPKLDVKPTPIAPVPYKQKPSEKTLTFVFYGTTGTIRFDENKKVSLKGTDESAVSRFWKDLSGDAYDNVVADCLAIRKERDLCDWAYYKMTAQVAGKLYGTRNERAVFLAWLLSQSGFSVRLGRENGNIYLLPEVSEAIVSRPYWSLDGGIFPLLDEGSAPSLYIMNVKFPGTSPLRMRMAARNAFDNKPAPGRELASNRYPAVKAKVSCDENMLAFLRDLPTTLIGKTGNTDYLRYVELSFSDSVKQTLYPVLKKQIAGKTEAEAANILIDFVQTAFDYKTDPEAWGRERTFAPEETLYYPYSDCEDRAILFSRLVRDLLGLDVALVLYPQHLATAVRFTEDVPGDYFVVKGQRYLVCDPTFINTQIGRTMPSMDNTKANVFLF